MTKTVTAWHFLPDDGMTRYEPRLKVEVGQTLTFDGEPVLCAQGLHASRRAIDALRYAPGTIVCRVRLSGTIVEDNDKLVATKRTVLWMADATETLHHFACDEAELALDVQEKRKGSVDPRSRKAIEVKRLWLEGEATDTELDAAWAAAWVAVRAAAGDAARAAARAAAWAAVWDAARAAAWAAAGAAAGAAQNKRLEKALMKLKG